jgi:tetratricopeptide (TPR) repeat protein
MRRGVPRLPGRGRALSRRRPRVARRRRCTPRATATPRGGCAPDCSSGRARSKDAAAELEAVGDLTQAAELRASDDDHSKSAALYEQSGNLAQAAAAHRAAGEWVEAARCYEEIYDYGNALECWREQGDEARQLDLLEKLGEYQDAAQIARAMGDTERAIRNLQLIDARHPDYRHCCRQIAEIVSERGDHDLAVAKFDEALGPQGLETASLDVLESYAEILERAGKARAGVSVYETIQRRDVQRTDLTRGSRRCAARSTRGARPPGAARQRREPLRAARGARPRRHGRGVQGARQAARPRRRAQAPARQPARASDRGRAVRARGARGRRAEPPQHRDDLRRGPGERHLLHLDGAARGPRAERHPRRAAASCPRATRRGSARRSRRGCTYAHERKIVHRDIKTANLFFTKDQLVKIMDFGIAKSLEEVRRSTTVVGGTPYYMAPEQARGRASTTAPTCTRSA